MQTPIYLVVETSGSNTEHDYAKLEAFLEEAYNDEIVVDGIIAQDSAQQAAIWNLRESISEGLRQAGPPLCMPAKQLSFCNVLCCPLEAQFSCDQMLGSSLHLFSSFVGLQTLDQPE